METLPPELVDTVPIEVIKPDLYRKLLGGQAIEAIIENNVVLSSD
jgi:hypothetical protein